MCPGARLKSQHLHIILYTDSYAVTTRAHSSAPPTDVVWQRARLKLAATAYL